MDESVWFGAISLAFGAVAVVVSILTYRYKIKEAKVEFLVRQLEELYNPILNLERFIQRGVLNVEQLGLLRSKWHLAGNKLAPLLDSFLEKWERRLRLVSYLPETPVYGPEGRVVTEEEKAARDEELILRDQLEKDGQALLRITREERLGIIARLRTHTSKWI